MRAPRSASFGAILRMVPRRRRSCPTSSSGASEAGRDQGEVRRGRHRGRGRTGGRQQRSAAGMFVPLLALGLPATATAAVIIAAMRTYGIQPGPTLMADQPELVWTLLASLLIGNTPLLVINLPLAAAVGQAAADPPAPAVRRDPVLRVAGRLQRQPGPVRPAAAVALRRDRFRDPAVRDPRAALDPRRYPRTAHGAEDARGARPVQRRHQRPAQRGPGGQPLRPHRGHHRGAVHRRAGSSQQEVPARPS